MSLYDDAVSAYLAFAGDPLGKLDAAMRSDPAMPMAHILSGWLLVLSTGVAPNSPLLTRLRRRASILTERFPSTHRERALLAALHAWSEGRQREAAGILEAWLLEQPCDALALRLLHDTYYFLGDAQNLRDSAMRVIGAWDAGHPDYLRVCGMLAFGAEEAGQFALAETQAMRVLSEDGRDAWALHALIHVYESSGRRYEGQRMLKDARWFWDEANMLHEHLHWHWGLFQLEDGQFERAMMRYDWWIRETHSGEMLDIIDAASLLWRLELAGNEAFDRWEELAPLVEQYMHNHTSVWNDAHIALVLVAAGQDALAEEHWRSCVEFANKPMYGAALSSAVPCEADPVDDVAWDPAWQQTGTEWSAAAFEQGLERDVRSQAGIKQTLAAGEPSTAQRMPAANEVSTMQLPMPMTTEGLDLQQPGTAGGQAHRPVLCAPFAAMPVPQLVTTEAVPASIGGVGGIGLGSHSLHDQRWLMASVGLPLIAGLRAYRQGQYAEAVDALLPVRSLWHQLGGSIVQQDIWHQTLEAAATQSEQLLLARALLRERITKRPNNGLSMYHLSSVLMGLGDVRAGAHMRDRALAHGLGEERVSTPQANAMARTDHAWYE